MAEEREPAGAGYDDAAPYDGTRAEAAALRMEAFRPGLLRRISWGAVLAGAVIAFALQFLLGLLGIAIGAGVLNPRDLAGPGEWGASSFFYTVFAQIVSLIAGGFVAARLAGIPKNTTALIHGALVWAVVTLLSLYLASTAIGSAISGASQAVTALGQATGDVAETLVPEDLSALPTPDIEREDLPEGVRQALRENEISLEQLQAEIAGIYRETLSRQERERLQEEAVRMAGEVAESPADAGQDLEAMIERVVGQGGVISDEDRAELLDSLQRRLDLSNQEVNALVASIEEAARDAQANLDEAMRTAEREVEETADETANAVTGVALTLFIASVLGLLAAVGGGLAGEPRHALVRGEPLSV